MGRLGSPHVIAVRSGAHVTTALRLQACEGAITTLPDQRSRSRHSYAPSFAALQAMRSNGAYDELLPGNPLERVHVSVLAQVPHQAAHGNHEHESNAGVGDSLQFVRRYPNNGPSTSSSPFFQCAHPLRLGHMRSLCLV